MPITEAQRLKRRKRCYSTDVSAILGLNPWSNIADVWHEKVYGVKDGRTNQAMSMGNYLEDSILDWFQDSHGPIRRNIHRVYKGKTPLGTHCDAELKATGDPVEAKTSGLTGPLGPEWGAAGTDQIPSYYWIQCHVHMICMGRDLCHVPCLLGNFGFRLYLVRRDDEVVQVIHDRVNAFWDSVKSKVKPDVPPKLDVIHRINRRPSSVTVVDTQLFKDYERTKAEATAESKDHDDAKVALLTAVEDNESAHDPDGNFELTMSSYTRTSFDSKALRKDHPDLYAKYVNETECKRLNVRKVK